MSRLVAAMCVVLAVAAATSVAATAENPVRSTYIVVLNPDAARSAGEAGSQRPLVSLLAGEIARAHDGGLEQVFQYALKGFSVEMTEKQAAGSRRTRGVAYVEDDQVIQAIATQSRPRPGGSTASTSATCRSTTPTPTPDRRRACTRTSSTPASALTHAEFGGRVEQRLRRAIDDGSGTTTATATARTSPARSAARPTAWPRA